MSEQTQEGSEMSLSLARVTQMARKDFRDAIRERQLHLLVGLFGLLGMAVGYFSDQNVGDGLFLLLVALSPLVGLAFTQHSIAGRRARDELSVILGLPFSRLDIVVGTFLGRTGVLVVGLVSIYAGAIFAGLVTGVSFDPVSLLGGFVLATIIGVVFVSIALGVSAATRSPTIASIGAFGAYFVFVFQLWVLIPDGVLYLVNGFEIPETRPNWATVFEQLSPFASVRNAALPVLPELADGFPLLWGDAPDDESIYMQPWFALLTLLGWVVLPVVLGYRRFNGGDL